jgi:hypothetical protein
LDFVLLEFKRRYELEHNLTSPRPTAVALNEETKETTSSLETWVFIRIERPVLSLDIDDTSTTVPSTSADAPTSVPNYQLDNTPPNFPQPIPDSCVVFAIPLAHVTEYPDRLERVPRTAMSRLSLHRRLDFDFSQAGAPLFDFSSSAVFAGRSMEFLSVEGIGGIDMADKWEEYTKEEYDEQYNKWVAAGGSEKDEPGKWPCPNKGVWWREFYKRVAEDAERWVKIKEAMERGKCRVVLRYTDVESFVGLTWGHQMGMRQQEETSLLRRSLTVHFSNLQTASTRFRPSLVSRPSAPSRPSTPSPPSTPSISSTPGSESKEPNGEKESDG